MFGAALLIIGVQYLSEKSMDSIIEVASDSSNAEYDFSLPFVTAEFQKVYDGEDFNKNDVLWYSKNEAQPVWEGEKFDNFWRHEGKMGYVEEFWSEQQCHS
jgi:hypothetical protein